MKMAHPPIEELQLLIAPRKSPPEGEALYEVEFPGVTCPSPSCPARSWTSLTRYWGEVPETTRCQAQSLRNHGQDNIPVQEYEKLLGRRLPTSENPECFPYLPGARAGKLFLFFCSLPKGDILWPAGARGIIVKERVKSLFAEHNFTGVIFRPTVQAKVVNSADLKLRPGESRPARLMRLFSNGSSFSDVHFFELEPCPPPADCGLRRAVLCERCGYTTHDCRAAKTTGSLLSHNGNEVFDIVGLGRPVFTRRVVDILESEAVRVFESVPVQRTLMDLIRESQNAGASDPQP